MLVHKTHVWEGYGHPSRRAGADGGSKLEVHVIFTNLPGTQATLKTACGLARDLGARVTILAAQVVPYPLSLENPPVPADFTERMLARIAREQDVETIVQVYLCRDLRETVRQALSPQSVVVVGGRRRWWPTPEQSLAATLRRDGHRVILVDIDGVGAR